MRVLLTGGSGSVGKAVVQRLSQHGFSVLVIGRSEGVEVTGADYAVCDVVDFPRLREVIRGCEAVIHLAALPTPGSGTPNEVYEVNTQGTFNVFQAAAEEGIRRVVQASSINATGQFFGLKPAPLHYLPLDEAHPLSATDAYSFSKHIIEEIGEYFWRREGIVNVAYRLPWVAPSDVQERVENSRSRIQTLVEDLSARSPQQRREWFDTAWSNYNALRANAPYEKKGYWGSWMADKTEEERAMLNAMSLRVNFFTQLDERDSAQAMEKGLTADFTGSHTLFINDSHNWTRVPSQTLAEYFYPDVTTFSKPLVGTESLVSIDRARALIGFEPEYSFA